MTLDSRRLTIDLSLPRLLQSKPQNDRQIQMSQMGGIVVSLLLPDGFGATARK